MTDHTLEAARRLGWPAERCHAERFGAAPDDAGVPFTVELTRSVRTIAVPAGTSLLDALVQNGIAWPSMCRRGVCGECRIDGVRETIDHRDLYLSDGERAAGTCLMPCVSRGLGPLSLDL